MRRALLLAAIAGITLPTALAHGQPFPYTPDRTRQGIPAYPNQGPVPLNQWGTPGVSPGVPQGVNPGLQATPPPRPRPPTLPPDLENPLPEASRLAFRPRGDLPAGVEVASVHVTAEGDTAEYLRLPPGAHIPAFAMSNAFELLLVRGDTRIVGERGVFHQTNPGTRYAIPALAVTEIFCGKHQDCLVYLASVGPLSLRYVHH
jgi:hypothetical protein